VDEIVAYEQVNRQGMSTEAPLPSLNDAQPVVESPAPAGWNLLPKTLEKWRSEGIGPPPGTSTDLSVTF